MSNEAGAKRTELSKDKDGRDRGASLIFLPFTFRALFAGVRVTCQNEGQAALSVGRDVGCDAPKALYPSPQPFLYSNNAVFYAM